MAGFGHTISLSVLLFRKTIFKILTEVTNYFYLYFDYIGFENINNVQDLSVYAVVKAIIFF